MPDRNKLKPRRSYTSGAAPVITGSTPDLERNEISINYADKILYVRDPSDQLLSIPLGGGGSSSGSLSGSVTIPASGEPQWLNTVLLLNGDGNLTDSSSFARTVTAYGNASATGTAKYGSNSINFDGNGDYLTLGGSGMDMGTGDFTVEMWVYPRSWCANAMLTGGSTGALAVQRMGTSNSIGVTAAGVSGELTDATLPPTNQWTHIAAVRQSGTLRFFINGVQSGSTKSSSVNFAAITHIGADPSRGPNNGEWFDGLIDDLRITKAARYSGTFTPPTATYATGVYVAAQTLPVTITGSGGGGSGLSWSSVPASATATGTAGQIAYDSSGYFYVCTAANTWGRTLLAWPDADATSFLAAAGITDATQSSAVQTLVGSLKSAGVWSKLLACYPFVGGSASTHRWNLKDPRDLNAAYRLTFTGSWSHASTGATPDGSSGYADTFLNPATVYTAGTYSTGIYLRTNPSSSQSYRIDMGAADQAGGAENGRFYAHIVSGDGNTYFDYNSRLTLSNSVHGAAASFHAVSRTSSTLLTAYRNGSATGQNTASQAWQLPNRTVWIGASNNSETGARNWSNREVAFAYLSTSLTGTEMAALNTAVQAFQTTLSRAV